jgi:hypothetical protein
VKGTPIDILTVRRAAVVAAVAAAAFVSGCARTDAVASGRFAAPGPGAVEVRVEVRPDHAREAARVLAAAVEALRTCDEGLGPAPYSSLDVIEAAPHEPSPGPDPRRAVIEPLPWLTLRSSSAIALATARAVSRQCWATRLDAPRVPRWFLSALVEVTARRAVVPLFQGEYQPPGYALAEQRYFGGLVPRGFRVRLLTETGGDPVPAYRADPGVDPRQAAHSRREAQSLEGKAVLLLGTLERWVGRPVFESIIAAFVREGRRTGVTIADFQRIAADVSGQDLSWLLEPALTSAARFDYAVSGLGSERDADGRFTTTVTARRLGDGIFSGTSAPRVGRFESGRGLTMRVTFADGTRHDDYWDGRDRSKQFVYRSPARAVSAEIDPNRVILLDVNRTNNSLALRTDSTAANLWAARWDTWLEDLLLTIASLV